MHVSAVAGLPPAADGLQAVEVRRHPVVGHKHVRMMQLAGIDRFWTSGRRGNDTMTSKARSVATRSTIAGSLSATTMVSDRRASVVIAVKGCWSGPDRLYRSGRRSELDPNTAPPSGALSATIVPPCASTMRQQM